MNPSWPLFASWFADNGGHVHPSVEFAYGSLGNCLRVKLDGGSVQSTSRIVSCPRRLMVSFNNAGESSVIKRLAGRAIPKINNEIISLRLFLVEQYLLGQNSFWWPYIQSLPQPGDTSVFNNTVFFNEDDFRWLEGTNLGAATQTRKVLWRREFDDAMNVLGRESAAADWKNWTWFVSRKSRSRT